MADFSSLKQTIQAYIKQNGNEEITGNILQDVLLAMVSTMGDSAINALASALQDETTARQNQDATLHGNISAEATARQQADTALGGRIDGLQTAINGINTKLAEGYIYAGIATPSTNPGTPSGKVFYIAVQAGTYTNLGGTVVTEGITILKYNGTSWVKEQALFTDGGVFDISAYHATGGTLAKYVDLAEALNGGANIPQSLQKGGMSVKFVQSSDNKYVKFFCMAKNFTTDVTQWQGVDDEPTKDSPNVVKSASVYNLLSLYGMTAENITDLLDKRKIDINTSFSWRVGTLTAEGYVDTSKVWSIVSSISPLSGDVYFIYTEAGSVANIYMRGNSQLIKAIPSIVGNACIVTIPDGVDGFRIAVYRETDKANNVDVSGIISQVAATVHIYKIEDILVQHDNDGFNIWDEQILKGYVLLSGSVVAGNGFMSKNFIPVLPSTLYYFRIPAEVYNGTIVVCFYNENNNYIYSYAPVAPYMDETGFLVNTSSDARYARFCVRYSSPGEYNYNNDICINKNQPFEGISPINGDYIAHDSLENYSGFTHNEPVEEDRKSGVRLISPKWMKEVDYYIDNDTLLHYSIRDRRTSLIEKIPESGMYIYSENRKKFRIIFLKNTNGVWSIATDYSHYNHRNYYNVASYFPYEENVYYYIADSNEGIGADIKICYGKVIADNGRLPNLFPTAIYQMYDNVNDIERIYFDSGTSQFLTYGRFYGSILRTQDVSKITAAPPFSIFARIYKINDDEKKIEFVEDKFLITDHTTASAGIAGYSEIDFSNYNFNGYIMLAVEYGINEVSSGNFAVPFTGMLREYQNAQQSIFVEWRSGVSVTYDSAIPSIVKNNIGVITNNVFAPDLLKSPIPNDGGYSNWNRNYTLQIPAMGKCNSWWYNGSNTYNVPHMHVNPKSYITASKNRCSRVYVAPAQIAPGDKRNNNMYGSVCSSTVALILGIPCGIETMDYCSELAAGFNYRDFLNFEDVMTGDVFGQLSGDTYGGRNLMKPNDYGHVIYIAEKVSVNGEVICLNSFEGYSPWIGWDTYINHTAHVNYTMKYPAGFHNNFAFINFKSSKWFSDQGDDKMGGTVNDKPFKKLARPSYKLLQTIRNAYGQYDTQDYDVTEIMCDRGTDAVYCMGFNYVSGGITRTALGDFLGIYTSGITEIDLFKDGTFYKHVNLGEYTSDKYKDYLIKKATEQSPAEYDRMYDIKDEITNSGYYEIYVSGEKKESFYVPPVRMLDSEEDGDYMELMFEPDEENDKVIAFEVIYRQFVSIDITAQPGDTIDDIFEKFDNAGEGNDGRQLGNMYRAKCLKEDTVGGEVQYSYVEDENQYIEFVWNGTDYVKCGDCVKVDTNYVTSGMVESEKHVSYYSDIDGVTTYNKYEHENVCIYRVPKITEWCDGLKRRYSFVRMLRKTPYGTYYRQYNLQRAGYYY